MPCPAQKNGRDFFADFHAVLTSCSLARSRQALEGTRGEGVMATGHTGERAYVIYRGTGRGDRLVEVHIVAAPGLGTVADAWMRLTRLDPSVDPRSLEIETRRLPQRTEPFVAINAGRASKPIVLARSGCRARGDGPRWEAMKINVEVDCTPEEARAFLGLPDVKPMQEAMLAELQDRMSANIRAMDPQEMMRLWLSPGLESFGTLYELFARMAGGKRE